jgi:hypothetical protein
MLDHGRLLVPAPDTHAYGYQLLVELAARGIHVPAVLGYDAAKRATAMPDFRTAGYSLLQEKFVLGPATLPTSPLSATPSLN